MVTLLILANKTQISMMYYKISYFATIHGREYLCGLSNWPFYGSDGRVGYSVVVHDGPVLLHRQPVRTKGGGVAWMVQLECYSSRGGGSRKGWEGG